MGTGQSHCRRTQGSTNGQVTISWLCRGPQIHRHLSLAFSQNRDLASPPTPAPSHWHVPPGRSLSAQQLWCTQHRLMVQLMGAGGLLTCLAEVLRERNHVSYVRNENYWHSSKEALSHTYWSRSRRTPCFFHERHFSLREWSDSI